MNDNKAQTNHSRKKGPRKNTRAPNKGYRRPSKTPVRPPKAAPLKSLESLRAVACNLVHAVAYEHKSLTPLMPLASQQLADKDGAVLQELVYGTCRWHAYLETIHNQFLDKPLSWDDKVVESLLKIGIYQLLFMRIPAHAAINETVEAAEELGLERFKPLVNAVLRRVSELEPFEESEEASIASYPEWMQEKIKHNWPEQWQEILRQGNLRPPMTLRVNPRHGEEEHPRDAYLARLAADNIDASACQFAPFGIQLLKPTPVTKLPGFIDGAASVQDEAAQLCCELLELQSNHLVLDACAAPGGKTCAMLEAQPDIQLTALDSEESRAELITDNLQRLNLEAKLLVSRAESLKNWWDEKPFDRILLDAPCSASAVIRRHPDIKLLRQEGDIKALAALQMQLLETLWKTLKPGGLFLYATCSIFPQENSRIIERFLKQESTAKLVEIDMPWGIDTGFGRQLFPQENGHDGFFYARLKKEMA